MTRRSMGAVVFSWQHVECATRYGDPRITLFALTLVGTEVRPFWQRIAIEGFAADLGAVFVIKFTGYFLEVWHRFYLYIFWTSSLFSAMIARYFQCRIQSLLAPVR